MKKEDIKSWGRFESGRSLSYNDSQNCMLITRISFAVYQLTQIGAQ